jgi:hypothetical protein
MAECPDVYKNKFLSLLKDDLIFLKYGQICKLSNKEEKISTKIFIDFYPNTDNNPYQKQIGSLGENSAYSGRYLNGCYEEYILLDKLYDINNVDSFSSLIDKSITYLAFYAKQQIEEDIMNEFLKKENKENSDFPSESLKEKIISGKDELVKNKVPPFQDGYYICFIHPRKLEELIAHQYSSLLPVEEEGKKFYVDCFGIKYIPTQIPSLIKRSDNKDNKKVYQTIIIGTDAYGIVDLDENSVNVICENANQKTNIGYKLNLRMRLLNPQAIIKIESD